MSVRAILHGWSIFDLASSARRRGAENLADPPTDYADWRREELARKYADDAGSRPADDLSAEWGEAMRADERERYRR